MLFYRTDKTLHKYSLRRPTAYWNLENNRLNVTAGGKYGYHWNFNGLRLLYNFPIYVWVSKVVNLSFGMSGEAVTCRPNHTICPS